MKESMQAFFESINGKRIALIGMGRSHLPLISLFTKYGAQVIACDQRDREALGEIADKAESDGAVLSLGEHYLDRLDADIAALKLKQENGADYIITQLCWDLDQFERWMDAVRKIGVTIPIDVGVMPIVDIKTTIRMALSRNGCVMDRELSRLISKYWIFPDPFDSNPPYQDAAREQKKADFRKAGLEYTVRQIDRLRMMGIDGLHLYAMNHWEEVDYLVREAGIRTVI